MFHRLSIYCKEMHPLPSRISVSILLFFEIYFLVLLSSPIESFTLHLGMGEVSGCFTIFSFLLALRIADDFKDYETDLRLFPDRPLPSGRVYKRDLRILLVVICSISVVLNLLFMNNLPFFVILSLYAVLMSFWFFQRAKIQKSLPLALVTHNPVQIVMNIYVISYACHTYDIAILSFNNLIIAVTLYFPGLIWEISRKIRAPQDETEYVTYSKLFGYRRATQFIMLVMLLDLFTTSYLVYQLVPWGVVLVLASYLWLLVECFTFLKDPTRFRLGQRIEVYELIAEGIVVFFIAAKLFDWWG